MLLCSLDHTGTAARLRPDTFVNGHVNASATFIKDVMPFAFERMLRDEQLLTGPASDKVVHPVFLSITYCISCAITMVQMMAEFPGALSGHLVEAGAALIRAAGSVLETEGPLATHGVASCCHWCKGEVLSIETHCNILGSLVQGQAPPATRWSLLPWTDTFFEMVCTANAIYDAAKVRPDPMAGCWVLGYAGVVSRVCQRTFRYMQACCACCVVLKGGGGALPPSAAGLMS